MFPKPYLERGRVFGQKQLNVRVTTEDWEILAINAKKAGTTISELVRTYIEWGIENETP